MASDTEVPRSTTGAGTAVAGSAVATADTGAMGWPVEIDTDDMATIVCSVQASISTAGSLAAAGLAAW